MCLILIVGSSLQVFCIFGCATWLSAAFAMRMSVCPSLSIFTCLFCTSSVGAFGATFIPGPLPISDVTLFASRPGLRLWKASASGTVDATLMFRDQLTHFSDNTTLLHDMTLARSVPTKSEDRQFGRLLLYGASCLLTCEGTCLYLLDYVQNAVVCYHGNIGPVIDVAVCKDEVYVLRNFTHRPLIRLSQQPVFDNVSAVKGTFVAIHS